MLRSIILLLILLVVAVVLIAILMALGFWEDVDPRIKAAVAAMKQRLMFSSIFRALLTTYLATSISAFHAVKEGTAHGKQNFWVSLATLVMLFAFPIFSERFLKTKKKKVARKDFRARYGTLYSGVQVFNMPSALSVTTWFCARRFVLAGIVVFMSKFLLG